MGTHVAPQLHRQRAVPPRSTTSRTPRNFTDCSRNSTSVPRGASKGSCFISTAQTIQVNVTPDVGFAVVRGIGQHVEATVERDPATEKHAKGDHPVYNLVTLTAADGKTLIHSGGSGADMATVQGAVKRINYARTARPTA